jgi:hypothetical protein
LLARAVAGEAGVSFFSISGSEFVEMFVGGANAKGDVFAFRGYMVYEGQLFGVSMLVHTNGHVEMLDDDPMGFIVPLH